MAVRVAGARNAVWSLIRRARSARAIRQGREPLIDWLIGAVVVGAIAAPMFVRNSGFSPDWTNHLWLVSVETQAIIHTGSPTYFLNTSIQGVFYPWFAFYGGTLYVLTGMVAALLGDRPTVAYIGVTTVAIAAAYGGLMCIARRIGIRGLLAHAPAFVYVTSAYFIADLYGRSAWPEFMATCALGPLVASAAWLVTARHWHPFAIATLILSTVVFAGSHNITLAWGLVVVVAWGVLLVLATGGLLHLPVKRLAGVAGLVVIGLMLDGWFLVTDITHVDDVRAGVVNGFSYAATYFLDTPGVVFDPFRYVSPLSGTRALFVQAPDWFLAWALATAIVLAALRAWSRCTAGAFLASLALLTTLFVAETVGGFWSVVPSRLQQIQFPYRLDTYIAYAVAGLVTLAALRLQRVGGTVRAQRTRTVLLGALVGVAAISGALCVWQLWIPNLGWGSAAYRAELTPPTTFPGTWYDGGSYLNVRGPDVTAPPGRVLTIPPADVRGNSYAGEVSAPDGMGLIQTNIAAGNYIVQIRGVEWMGTSAAGTAVVRRLRPGAGPIHISVTLAPSRAIVLGRVATILGLLATLGALLAATITWFRRRRAVATLGN